MDQMLTQIIAEVGPDVDYKIYVFIYIHELKDIPKNIQTCFSILSICTYGDVL